jgi:hypothetical protein
MSTDDPERFAFRSPPLSQLHIKVAARCSIDASIAIGSAMLPFADNFGLPLYAAPVPLNGTD